MFSNDHYNGNTWQIVADGYSTYTKYTTGMNTSTLV